MAQRDSLGIFPLCAVGQGDDRAGVTHFYVTEGVPDASRILIDLWVAVAQVLGGALYLAAFQSARSHRHWRNLAALGAFTVVLFAASILPVLFARAPVFLRIPPAAYLAGSTHVLAGVFRASGSRSDQLG